MTENGGVSVGSLPTSLMIGQETGAEPQDKIPDNRTGQSGKASRTRSAVTSHRGRQPDEINIF